MDVRHHIVAEAPLVRGHRGEIDVLQMLAHLRDGFGRDIDTQRSLRLEIAVVVLIVIEVAIGCFQIWSGLDQFIPRARCS